MKWLMSQFAVTVALVAAMAVLPSCSSPSSKTGDGGTNTGNSDGGGNGHADAGTDGGGGSGMDGGGGNTSPEGKQTTDTMNKVMAAMSTFHADTGGWPLGDSVWYGLAQPWDANSDASTETAPGQFTQHDTALITKANGFSKASGMAGPLDACMGSPHTQPCWSGPYLMGDAQSMADVKDGWGHTLLFTYFGAFDNGTGTSPQALKGAIIIWSAGPDGLDQTGCTTTELGNAMNCSYDEDAVAQGNAAGDDMLMVISMDATSFK